MSPLNPSNSSNSSKTSEPMKPLKPYEYLEHTADVKLRAYGSTPEEMLQNAALALFNAMIDTSTVRGEETWVVDLSGDSLEDLAYRWLSELVFLFETEFAAFSAFDVRLEGDGKHGGKCTLHADVRGERVDHSRHAFDSEVKAVTLHEFMVKKNDVWCLQAVLDV